MVNFPRCISGEKAQGIVQGGYLNPHAELQVSMCSGCDLVQRC